LITPSQEIKFSIYITDKSIYNQQRDNQSNSRLINSDCTCLSVAISFKSFIIVRRYFYRCNLALHDSLTKFVSCFWQMIKNIMKTKLCYFFI